MPRAGIALALALTFAGALAGCAGAGRGGSSLPPPPPPPTAHPPARTLQPPAVATSTGPRWRPSRVHADAPLVPEGAIAVLPGDTLAGLAARAGASAGALAVANRLAGDRALAPGQRLIVPAGRWHIVRAGETGIAIARAYGAAWPRVIRTNGLVPPYALEVGDRLLIPARVAAVARPTVPVPATIEGRAHAFDLDIDALLGKAPRPLRARAAKAKPANPISLSREAGEGGASQRSPKATEGVPGGETPSDRSAATSPASRERGIAETSIHLEWPLTGRVLSAFGPKPGGRFNDGINIAAIAGAPVRAAAYGTVAYAGNGVAAFGGLILIRHAGGWLTAYAHCEALLVAKGDTVRAGQTIAKAGATGEVDAPQLHFEVRRGRVPVDPARLLAGR